MIGIIIALLGFVLACISFESYETTGTDEVTIWKIIASWIALGMIIIGIAVLLLK